MKKSAKPSKALLKLNRSTPLKSYLAITAGAASASLPTVNAAIMAYNGAPVTIILNDGDKFLYWGPNAAFDGTIAGTAADQGTDRFNFNYPGANYIYSEKNESTIKMYFGTAANVPLKLTSGDTIDGSINWFSDTWSYMNKDGWTTADSPWATGQDGTQGVVPFYFAPAASTNRYYGWADFTYNNASGNLILNNFAYENTPNKSINAGATTRVVLYDLYLQNRGGAMVVCWQTASEEKSVGFDLYREENGAWVKINSALIAARGVDGMGAAYEVADAGANATDTFRYKLVEIETDGGVQEYGPFDEASSDPRLNTLEATPDGMVLRWTSREQDTYEVQRTFDLKQPFETIATDIPATPSVNSYTDQDEYVGSAYYRIRIK